MKVCNPVIIAFEVLAVVAIAMSFVAKELDRHLTILPGAICAVANLSIFGLRKHERRREKS
jgi:hypothetical protein